MADPKKERKTQRASAEEIELFRSGVDILRNAGYSMNEIAIRIRNKTGNGYMTEGNFTNYYNLTHTITENFLLRFYAAWREEIKVLKAAMPTEYTTEPSPALAVKSEKMHEEGSLIELVRTLQRNNDALQRNLTMVIDTNRKLADSHELLARSHKKLLESYLSPVTDKEKKPPLPREAT